MVVMAVHLHGHLLLLLFLSPLTNTITIATIITTTTMPILLLKFHLNPQPVEVHLRLKTVHLHHPQAVHLHLRMVHLPQGEVHLPPRKVMQQSHLVAILDIGLKGKRESGLTRLLLLHHQSQMYLHTIQLRRRTSKYLHQDPSPTQFQFQAHCQVLFLLMFSPHQRANQIKNTLIRDQQLHQPLLPLLQVPIPPLNWHCHCSLLLYYTYN